MSNIKVEMLSMSDFNQICRTCSADGDLQSLFENIEILSMLESFTQMQFSKTDELPDKICANCLTKINDCYNFINNCKIVDEGFRKCLNENLKQLEQKTNELHSSIEIKEEEEDEEQQTETEEDEVTIIEDPLKTNEMSSPPSDPSENIKLINMNQPEYYILQWPNSHHQQVDTHFKVITNNQPPPLLVPKQNMIIEQEAVRRINAANRMRRLRVRQCDDTEAALTKLRKKIQSQINQSLPDEETHRARAKLTLPPNDDKHNYMIRSKKFETPEMINYRRAIAREQLRKYRMKLTAAEVAEHRAEASERVRKVRARFNTLDLEQPFDDSNTQNGGENSKQEPEELKVPLRLAEMAQTLLKSKTMCHEQDGGGMLPSKFSLRPTKIPHVRKQNFETKIRTDHPPQIHFRSWKRQSEAQDQATIRLAKQTLQMKTNRDAAQMEESALRRAKAAGQLKQYGRPMYRKNKTIPVPIGQSLNI